VPLSENEQRQLEAIERALTADDPKFAATVRSSDLRSFHRRRLVKAVVLFTIGLVLLVFTIVNIWFGLAGFAVMFLAAVLGISAFNHLRGPVAPSFGRSGGAPTRGSAPHVGWRERIEDRFKRRFDDRG
jgi:hypothetical protein